MVRKVSINKTEKTYSLYLNYTTSVFIFNILIFPLCFFKICFWGVCVYSTTELLKLIVLIHHRSHMERDGRQDDVP